MCDNFDFIESHLSRFGDGEVVISREYFDKGLAVIYLNNPRKKNALSGKMMVELRQCILELEQWQQGKAVLLSGLNDNFCSGADLDFVRKTGTPEQALQMSSWMEDTLERLKKLSLISICLIHGPSLGGGAEIAIHCDFVLAAENVKFGFLQGKLGIITAWGGGTHLVKKIGMKNALDLLLTSKILTAQECLDYQIAHYVVPLDNYLAKAIDWIDQRLQHHHTTIQLFKQVAYKADTDTVANSLAFEKQLFVSTWGGDLNKKALSKKVKHLQIPTSKI